jgi:gamma-glutamylcyclotransferase
MPIRYFAYGSNMAESVMTSHCPGHRYLGRAELPGHRLAFTRRSVRTGTGVADIVPADGQSVWGALYELDEAGLFAIDQKEGNGSNYERTLVRVRLDSEKSHAEVLTYAVIDPLDTEVKPSPEYLGGLFRAAHARGLPDDYLQALATLAETSRGWL